MKLILLTLALMAVSLASMAWAEGDRLSGRFDAEAQGHFDFDFEGEEEHGLDRRDWQQHGDDSDRAHGHGCRDCCGRHDLKTCCYCPRGRCGPEGFPGHPGQPGRPGEPGRDGLTIPRLFGQVVNVAQQTIPAATVIPNPPAGAAAPGPLPPLPEGQFVSFDTNGLQEGVFHKPGTNAVFVEKEGDYLATILVLTSPPVPTTCTIYVNGIPLSSAQYSYTLVTAKSLTAILHLKSQAKLQLFCHSTVLPVVLPLLKPNPINAPQTANANLVLVAL